MLRLKLLTNSESVDITIKTITFSKSTANSIEHVGR